jgi:hypothetical protein
LEESFSRKVCILGTHHDYQIFVVRSRYLQTVDELVTIHQVDLVAEEASESLDTYARQWVEERRTERKLDIKWDGVDLNSEERKGVPDANPDGIGTLQDLDFQNTREWTWVVRTSKAMKRSALLICGWAHALSVAEKFRWAGFDIEIHVYFDKKDADAIRLRTN